MWINYEWKSSRKKIQKWNIFSRLSELEEKVDSFTSGWMRGESVADILNRKRVEVELTRINSIPLKDKEEVVTAIQKLEQRISELENADKDNYERDILP